MGDLTPDSRRRPQLSSPQPPMANICQMMCVIQTESMMRFLWHNKSFKELISYANERNKSTMDSLEYTCTHSGTARVASLSTLRLNTVTVFLLLTTEHLTRSLWVSPNGQGWIITSASHSTINPLLRGQRPSGLKAQRILRHNWNEGF